MVPQAKMQEVVAIAKIGRAEGQARRSEGRGHDNGSRCQQGPVGQDFKASSRKVSTKARPLLLAGLGRPEGLNKGFYVLTTVFADVTNDMTIAREEIFGPVLSIIGYRDEADAVTMANRNALWTRRLRLVWAISSVRGRLPVNSARVTSTSTAFPMNAAHPLAATNNRATAVSGANLALRNISRSRPLLGRRRPRRVSQPRLIEGASFRRPLHVKGALGPRCTRSLARRVVANLSLTRHSGHHHTRERFIRLAPFTTPADGASGLGLLSVVIVAGIYPSVAIPDRVTVVIVTEAANEDLRVEPVSHHVPVDDVGAVPGARHRWESDRPRLSGAENPPGVPAEIRRGLHRSLRQKIRRDLHQSLRHHGHRPLEQNTALGARINSV